MSEFERVGNTRLSVMAAVGELGLFVPLTGTGLAVKSVNALLLPFLLFVLLSLGSASLFCPNFPESLFAPARVCSIPVLTLSSFHHGFRRVAGTLTPNSLAFCVSFCPPPDTVLEQYQNKKMLK